VKVAFVVGFFSAIDKSLCAEFEQDVGAGRVVFFHTVSEQRSFNFPQFKSLFFEVVTRDDPDPVYVFAAEMRHPALAWVRRNLQGIVNSARGRDKCRAIELVFFSNAQDAEPVADSIRECHLAGEPETRVVEEELLRRHANGVKILCIRGEQQSSFEEALRRADIQFENFSDHFDEVPLPYGSNVGRTVKQSARSYNCLLYAYGELKYVQPAIKDKWKAFHQGKTPAAAVARFKEAVLGSSKPPNQQDDP
jgi:hypothetical protein